MTEAKHAKKTAPHRAAAPRGAHAPINAAEAAHRAARTVDTKERTRQRQAAAGVGRARAEELGRAKSNGHAAAIAGAVIGIALACALIWFVGGAVLRVFMADGPVADEVAAADRADTTASATADASGTLDVIGFTYSFELTPEGDYALARQNIGSSADPLTVFLVTGEPVGMATYNGVIYVVSNLDGSFYLQSFIPGDGSVPSEPTQEEGTVTGIELQDSELRLTEEGGRIYTLELGA